MSKLFAQSIEADRVRFGILTDAERQFTSTPFRVNVKTASLSPPDPENGRPDRTRRAHTALILSDSKVIDNIPPRVVEAVEKVIDPPDGCRLAGLLADLAHWCDFTGYNFADCLQLARAHYLEETANEGTQFAELFL